MVGQGNIYLRVEHVGYWIWLRRIDGNHLNGFPFAIWTHSDVYRTCTALQLLSYLALLPRLYFHLLQASLFPFSYFLATRFLLPYPPILHFHLLSPRVAPLIRLLLIPRRELLDAIIALIRPHLLGLVPVLLSLHKCNVIRI